MESPPASKADVPQGLVSSTLTLTAKFMIEVYPNIFVGNDADANLVPSSGWSVVHAAKEPWHRMALGYTTKAAPKEHSEYLIARRGADLCMNFVDGNDPKWISDDMINASLSFIDERLAAGDKVLIHCNQGQSRGPGIAFLYLRKAGALPGTFQEAYEAFLTKYPTFNPALGVRGYIQGK